MEILRDSKLLDNESVDIDADVLPDARPQPDGKSNPGRQHDGLLGALEELLKSVILQLSLVSRADRFELCQELMRLQNPLPVAFDPATNE